MAKGPDALKDAERRITTYLNRLPKQVFGQREMEDTLRSMRNDWRLPSSVRFSDFLEYLEGKGLEEIVLESEQYTSVKKFGWRNPSSFQLACSLRPSAYLCHGSAVFLHGLTDRIPRTIYVNAEQSAKERSDGSLRQDALDRAFAGRQRVSKHVFRFRGVRALLLSGKNTGRLEVGTVEGPEGESLPVTKVERTLIDIVVRPAYAGGVNEVLEAYKRAKELVSVPVLVRTLQKLEYLYPYHQAIGFLMEKAGYDESKWSRLAALGLKFDFYLVHGMKKKAFDEKWRLFVPEGF